MNVTATLAMAGAVIAAALAAWTQAKKFNTYRTRKKILALEKKRDEIEDEIKEKIDTDWIVDSDTWADWNRVHIEREMYNRDILQLRRRCGDA